MSYQEKFDQNQDSEYDIEEKDINELEEESYEGKECAICKDVPESIIYLSCDHIICLFCAAKSILSNENTEEIDFSHLNCMLCGESTILSQEVQMTLCEFLTQEKFQMNSDDEQNESQDNEQLETEGNEKQDQSDEEESVKQSNERQKMIKKVETEKQEETEKSYQNDTRVKNKNSENQEEVSDDQESKESDVTDKSQNMSFVFACQIHYTEDYQYYNPDNKKLYCAQCLLEQNGNKSIPNVKPIKRCFPEILQNVQDMINDVEVSKNLMENKKKDFEIRKENCKTQIYSYYKKFEIQLNEVSQQINDQKNNFLQEFEKQGEKFLEEIQVKESEYDQKISYFGSIVAQVNQLKEESESPEEEILSFFFANQDKINEALQTQKNEENEKEPENRIFKEFQKKLEREQQYMILKSLENLQEKIGMKIQQLNKALKINNNSDPKIFTQENHPLNFSTKFENETQSKTQQNQSIYNNYLEKINQYSRPNKSISVEHSKVKGYQYCPKKKLNLWDADSSKLSKEFTHSYFNTLNKSQYKVDEQKDKKVNFLYNKYKKDSIFNSYNSMVNFKKTGNQYSNNLYKNKFHLQKYETLGAQKCNLKSFNNKSLMSIKQFKLINRLIFFPGCFGRMGCFVLSMVMY